MPDLGLSVTLTRDALALVDLQINDHIVYAIGEQLFGGQQTWNRNQVGSPFLDDQVTTFRTRQKVTETVVIEVFGQGSVVTLQSNLNVLINAFQQDQFNIAIQIGSATWQYNCEAADFSVTYQGYRWIEKQVQVTFQVPRSPVPILGGF